MKSLEINLFVKKINMIQFLQQKYNSDYQEIAFILNDHPKIIETYCHEIIASKERMLRINQLRR